MNLAVLTKLALKEEQAKTGNEMLNKLDIALMAKANLFNEIRTKAELINRQIDELYKIQNNLKVQETAIEIEINQVRNILKNSELF